jgi:hypothetical protein
MVQTNACKLVHFFSQQTPPRIMSQQLSCFASFLVYDALFFQLFLKHLSCVFFIVSYYNYYFNRYSLCLVPALAQYRVKVVAENHSVTLADHHQTGLSPSQLLAALNASIDGNSSVFNATTGEWVHAQPTDAPHNPADDNNRYRGQLFFLFFLFDCYYYYYYYLCVCVCVFVCLFVFVF